MGRSSAKRRYANLAPWPGDRFADRRDDPPLRRHRWNRRPRPKPNVGSETRLGGAAQADGSADGGPDGLGYASCTIASSRSQTSCSASAVTLPHGCLRARRFRQPNDPSWSSRTWLACAASRGLATANKLSACLAVVARLLRRPTYCIFSSESSSSTTQRPPSRTITASPVRRRMLVSPSHRRSAVSPFDQPRTIFTDLSGCSLA